jgi:hypothetical protein
MGPAPPSSLYKNMKAIYLTAITSVVATMNSTAAFFPIDQFGAYDDGSLSHSAEVNLNSPNAGIATKYSSLFDPNVYRGQRDLAVHRTTATDGLVRMDVDNTILGQATYTSTTASHGHVFYDGFNVITEGNPTINHNGLGFDATDAGSNYAFQIQAAADTAVSIMLEVYKLGSSTDVASFTIPVVAGNVNTLLDYVMPFSLFTSSSGFDLDKDFADIGAMVLTINYGEVPNANIAFDNFAAIASPVPEARHYAMFAGFGCLGFAFLRNRFMKAT